VCGCCGGGGGGGGCCWGHWGSGGSGNEIEGEEDGGDCVRGESREWRDQRINNKCWQN
jgi:hypothetical protein